MSMPPLPTDADRRRNVESWRRANGHSTPRRRVQSAAPAPAPAPAPAINWADDPLDIRPSTRSNFVAPAPVTAIVRAEPPPLGYMPALTIPGMPMVTVDDDGRWAIQRAKGFAIKTSMLGAGFALAAATVTLIAMIGRTGAATTALVTIAVLFTVFAGVWLYALRQEIDTSAGGIARRHAERLWEFVTEEQAHLHEMERNRWNNQ